MIKKLLTTIVIFATCYQANSNQYAPMPQAISNNAVAKVTVNNKNYLLSFNGLAKGKSYLDVNNHAYLYDLSADQWQAIQAVPIQSPVEGLVGRLASVAVGIDRYAYIFGGYTVAKDHSEVSVPDVYRYDMQKDHYQLLAPMPVPVDDSVALVYQQKYIYLISGWHNSGNVNFSSSVQY